MCRKSAAEFANTGSPRWPAASSHGPSPWPAAGSGQTSGSWLRYGSDGTLCWRQRCELLRELCIMTGGWGKLPYSLHSLVDISPVPPAASGEHLGHSVIHASHSHPHRVVSASLLLHSHHSDVGVPPVAVISVVNEARRLASQKSQRLLGQQSPGGLHDSAETLESEREWPKSFLLSALNCDGYLPWQSVYIQPSVAAWRCPVSSIF